VILALAIFGAIGWIAASYGARGWMRADAAYRESLLKARSEIEWWREQTTYQMTLRAELREQVPELRVSSKELN
jgi:hypothetical protein